MRFLGYIFSTLLMVTIYAQQHKTTTSYLQNLQNKYFDKNTSTPMGITLKQAIEARTSAHPTFNKDEIVALVHRHNALFSSTGDNKKNNDN